MNFFEERKLTAEHIEMEATEELLKDLFSEKRGYILSNYPTLNGLEISFTKDVEFYTFKTKSILMCDNPFLYQSKGYGILDPFKIKMKDRVYDIPRGAKSISFKLKEMELSGNLLEINYQFASERKSFFRALIPLVKNAKPPLRYLLGRAIIWKKSFKAAGYIDVKINEHDIGIYDYTLNEQDYFIIDVKSKVSYHVFNQIIETIQYGYGFISGFLLRNNIIVLQSKDPNYTNIEGFKYCKLKDNVISLLEIYNPDLHMSYFNLKSKQYFPISVFSDLLEKMFNSRPLLRAIRTMTQARNQPVEIETAAFYIALETVKQIVIDENMEKIQPIKEKSYSKKLVKQLKSVVKPLPAEKFNDKNAVIRKIENINSVGNTDAFALAFKCVGIKLSKEDIECISMRNKFLHGNVPYDHESDEVRNKELSIINLSAHLLTCSLILKYAGYSGVVKNYLKYLDLINGFNQINQPLFRKI